ncbi:MFS transporter [Catellatospora methionotrophica]|uniref:MFS transporter n=1 Tax=Catellatospora methionotrophica TaxID=121620 RepID=UPI0033F6A964
MTSAVAVRSAVQVRTIRLLMVVEVVSGLGVAMGISVGALLTRAMAGTALSGVAQSAAVVGGGVLAVPAATLMSRYGRRPGLALCYLVGAVGAVAVLASALLDSIPLLFVGFFLFGAGSTAKLQSRYAATDLAEPHRRGRQLSLVVWSTTFGAVIGPNLAAPLGSVLSPLGVPDLAGPFAFAAASFLISALLLTVFLRPDPLLTAQSLPLPDPRPAFDPSRDSTRDPDPDPDSTKTGQRSTSVTGQPVPGQLVAEQRVPGQQVPGQLVPGQLVAEQRVPGQPVSAQRINEQAGKAQVGGPVSLAGAPAVGVITETVVTETVVTTAVDSDGAAPDAPLVAERQTLGSAARAVLASPAARLGMASMALGHLVMVAVMAMTPVHIGETHSAPDTLRIVGFVLSMHVAGMYGLSPVVGWLTDRVGRVQVILGGVGLLVIACAVAATAGHDTALLTAALLMLGLGWSGTMVAGSTLFTASLPAGVKPRAQGLSDLVTGLAGASAGVLSGIVVELSGYAVLALLAGLATVPLVALALRPSTLAAVKVAD